MKGSISISTFKGNKSSNQDRFSVDAKIISHDSPRIDCELEFELDETYHVVAVADGVTNSIDGGKAAEFVVKAIYDSYEEGVLTFEDEKDDVKETLKDCFDKIIIVKKLEDGKYDARYNLESFIDANNDIIDDKTKGIFDGVDLKISNMIGELAVAFKEYLESVLNAFNNDDDGFYRKLKQ